MEKENMFSIRFTTLKHISVEKSGVIFHRFFHMLLQAAHNRRLIYAGVWLSRSYIPIQLLYIHSMGLSCTALAQCAYVTDRQTGWTDTALAATIGKTFSVFRRLKIKSRAVVSLAARRRRRANMIMIR